MTTTNLLDTRQTLPEPNSPVGIGEHRQAYLDVLRAVACLMVFFYHIGLNLFVFGGPIYGYNGVHLFFVLSGYLLGGRYVDAFVNVRPLPKAESYLVKRILRIYPAYAISLTIFIALRYFTHVQPPSAGNCLTHYLLIFNYFDRYDFYSISGVVWSLAIELQFYLILPLVGYITGALRYSASAKGWIFPLGVVVLGVGSRWFECKFISHYDPRAITLVPFKWCTSYLDLFAMGILARRVELTVAFRNSLASKATAYYLVILGPLILWAVGLWTPKSGNWQTSTDILFLVVSPIPTTMALAMIMLGVGSTMWRDRPVYRWTGLAALGKMSYSVYLYHVGVLFCVTGLLHHFSGKFSPITTQWVIAIISLPLTLIVAWASYRWVEVPCMTLAARLTEKSGRGNFSTSHS